MARNVDIGRDLAARVKARADDLVRKSEVRSETAISERVLIEANAEAPDAISICSDTVVYVAPCVATSRLATSSYMC